MEYISVFVKVLFVFLYFFSGLQFFFYCSVYIYIFFFSFRQSGDVYGNREIWYFYLYEITFIVFVFFDIVEILGDSEGNLVFR